MDGQHTILPHGTLPPASYLVRLCLLGVRVADEVDQVPGLGEVRRLVGEGIDDVVPCVPEQLPVVRREVLFQRNLLARVGKNKERSGLSSRGRSRRSRVDKSW